MARDKQERRREEGQRLTQLLVDHLGRLSLELGQDRVHFGIEPGDGEFYTTIVSLTPTKSGTAPVKAYVYEGDPTTVYLGLGDSTWIEVFGTRTVEALVARIAELVDLVRRGRFKEKIWSRRGKVTDTHGRIQLENGRWRLIGRLNRPLLTWGYRVEHRAYAPWD